MNLIGKTVKSSEFDDGSKETYDINCDTKKIFYIKNPATGKYLDNEGGKCDSGNKPILWTFNGSGAQQFYWGPNNEIMNVGCRKALDIAGAKCDAGAPLIFWDHHGGSNQQFEVKNGGLWNKKCNKVIDIHGSNGSIIMWDPHWGPNQQWQIVDK